MTDLTSTTLLRWIDQSQWHIAQSELHGMTFCETKIPHDEMPIQHVKTGPVQDTEGLCFKCFHNLCIETQNERLWSIYYKVVEG